MPATERKSMQDNAEEWVTLAVAARELGCSRTKVLAYALRGELQSDVRGAFTFIERQSLDALKVKRAAAEKKVEGKGRSRAKKAPRSRKA